MATQQDRGATTSYAREAHSEDAGLSLTGDVAQVPFCVWLSVTITRLISGNLISGQATTNRKVTMPSAR